VQLVQLATRAAARNPGELRRILSVNPSCIPSQADSSQADELRQLSLEDSRGLEL
jgi:hypothetical protein